MKNERHLEEGQNTETRGRTDKNNRGEESAPNSEEENSNSEC